LARASTTKWGATGCGPINPYFDFRLSGSIALAGEGYKDLARLADCNPRVAGVQPCHGNDAARKAEARFRARF
jgi:hypothetical protein